MKKSSPENFSNLFSFRKPIVLTGMMGAGKSSVGRHLARLCGLPFFDADSEIEASAGRSSAQIFSDYGETEFRRLERQVIARLLDGDLCVLSLGGGAFADADTRARVKQNALSVWLKVDPDLLLERVLRHGERPMLKNGDPAVRLTELLAVREPFYSEADLTVLCDDRPVVQTAQRVLEVIKDAPASRTR